MGILNHPRFLPVFCGLGVLYYWYFCLAPATPKRKQRRPGVSPLMHFKRKVGDSSPATVTFTLCSVFCLLFCGTLIMSPQVHQVLWPLVADALLKMLALATV